MKKLLLILLLFISISVKAQYDSSAQVFFTSASITDTVQKRAVNDFVLSLKNDSIWDKGLDIGIYLSNNTIANALKKLKYPSSFSTSLNNGTTALTNSNYSNTTGVSATANGKRISTQIIPANHGLSKNNISVIFGCLNDISGTGNLMLDNKLTGPAGFGLAKTSISIGGGVGLPASNPQYIGVPYLIGFSSNGYVNYVRDLHLTLPPVGHANQAVVPNVTFDTEVSIFQGRSAGAVSNVTGKVGFHWIGEYLTYDEMVLLNKAVRKLWRDLGRLNNTTESIYFGDSWSFGVGSSAYNKRFTYLLAQHWGQVERNCALSGSRYATSGTLLYAGYERRSNLFNYDIVPGSKIVIEYGGNDCRLDAGGDTGTTSIKISVRDKLITLVNELKSFGIDSSDITIVGVPLLNDGTNLLRCVAYTNECHKVVAQTTGVLFIDIKAYMEAHGGTSLLNGTSHPTDAGHQVVYEGILTAAIVP